MTDTTWRFHDPFGEAMQRLWDRALAVNWPQAALAAQEPGANYRFPVNVYEDGHNYYLTCMMPGVRSDSVEVTVEGAVLTISGRYQPQTPDGANAVLTELGPVQFRRQFTLGAGFDQDGVQAHYQDGILSLIIAKAAANRTRRIPITSAAAQSAVTEGSGKRM